MTKAKQTILNRLLGFLAMLCCASSVTLFLQALPCTAATPEVRGTWLTSTGPDHITSGGNTEAVFGDLRSIGLNTAYVETWKNGFTNFPSPTLAALTGGGDRSGFLGLNRDLVEETLIAAHREQMVHIG